jgi:hypothetical protein
MNGPSDVFNIVWSERYYGETAILGHVDGMLLLQFLHLLLVQTGVAEHAYLLSDVGPVSRRAWRRGEMERENGGVGEGEMERGKVGGVGE